MKIPRLLDAMDLLVLQASTEFNEINDEITDLLPEYLEEIFRLANLAELEVRLGEVRKFDTSNPLTVLSFIEKHNPKEYELGSPAEKKRKVIPSEAVAIIKDAIKTIGEHGPKWNPLEVNLRIQLLLDPKFNDLLMAFEADSQVFQEVAKNLRHKLAPIPNDEILIMWAGVLNLFKENGAGIFLKKYPDVIPVDYFKQNSTVDEARDKLSIFISKIYPITLRRMVEGGVGAIPATMGVARIAMLNHVGRISKITNLDQMVARLTSETIAMWEELTSKAKEQLARSINAVPNGFVFDGSYYHEFKDRLNKHKASKKDKLAVLANMMRRLFNYSEEYRTSSSDIATALWQYKLGQEIIAPSQTAAILSGEINELQLQKTLSKYLIEKGILSFGRTFGRNEIDLYYKEFGEDFAIETKIYKMRPTEALIKTNLVQLQSYLDQICQPRGILLIYNCSDDLIIAPRKWIRGRLWVLPINMGENPPSKRTRSIEIDEDANGNQLVVCIDNDAKATSANRVPKKRAQLKKKSKKHKRK